MTFMKVSKLPTTRPALTALVLLVLLAACAGTTYNLPPVTEQSSGEQHPGKFIWQDLLSDDVAGSQRFYSELFGWKFQSLSLLGAEYWLISLNGEPIGGMVNQRGLPAERDISQWVSVLSSADIDATTQAVAAAGGTVYRQPVSVGDRGRIAVYADPQGALFGGLETIAGDPAESEALPPAGGFLWHELWTSDADGAAGFYSSLSGLEERAVEVNDVSDTTITYHVLRAGKQARAGVRSRPSEDIPPVWMPYLRVASVEALEQLLSRVDALGGEVLVPAVERPGGGYVAVVAGPSGAPIALQTWEEGKAAPGSEMSARLQPMQTTGEFTP